MTYATTDLSDAHPEAQTCEPVFRDYGGRAAFHGPIKTLKVFEDNALVRATLETPGEQRVLVVDGGGSTRCALFGGNLGQLAVKNGWAGVVVYGLIRDSGEISQQAFGLKALGTLPRKSEKGLHSAHADRVVNFAGVTFKPGAWLYADADGIVVSDTPIHE
ncbi:MAG: RraA family protein [Panacagrimonas sp.]|jgi:regulator of ribonuclease activity A|nr:ribonuclease E activity regulator RraA [Panacagrimonas sp.]MCC2655094.1 RraA family protein [Panacagrimonas sp.]